MKTENTFIANIAEFEDGIVKAKIIFPEKVKLLKVS